MEPSWEGISHFQFHARIVKEYCTLKASSDRIVFSEQKAGIIHVLVGLIENNQPSLNIFGLEFVGIS